MKLLGGRSPVPLMKLLTSLVIDEYRPESIVSIHGPGETNAESPDREEEAIWRGGGWQ